MASLPYVTSAGNIEKALNGIRTAAVPESVSQDFVKTILKIKGGSGNQMTTYLKKLGLANSDGSPSERYHKFRNPSSSGAAIASAIKQAYAPLYVRNEFMHSLEDAELTGLVIEETGLAHDSNPVKLVVNCIKQLKPFAKFGTDASETVVTSPSEYKDAIPQRTLDKSDQQLDHSIGLRLGYTINLNLPATSDPAVFDAIFKSLKANLLRDDDA